MNLDLTIHRMASREAPTLGEAQVLVAQKRARLEAALIQKQANDGASPTQATVERTVDDMQALSEQRMKTLGHEVDRLA